MSYNSKYFDRKPNSLENAVLDAVNGVINETNKNDKSDDGEGLDAVQPKAVKKKFKDRKDKDIDNDGDVDSSDEYLHKRRKAESKAIKSEGKLEDSPNPANSQHLCAKNVVHEEWGEGQCVPTMHADPDEDGNVAWYDVMFEHGIEKGVLINELKVTYAESHHHGKKKKVSEETELDEGKMKDLAMKIADVYKKMKADKQMKGFADKFRADVKKSLDIRKSLEKVLPDYVGGQQITKLMEIDLAKRLAVLKRAQGRTDAAGAAATKADKRDANVKKGMMPKAGSAADKADTKYRASKARQDRLAKNVATAQDREAERKIPRSKKKSTEK